jgi:hypothetical protein
MTKIRSSCLFVGDGFSPSSFSDGRSIDLHDAIEPGAFGLRGRFKGQPTPFGSASIQMPENEGNDWDSFYQLVDLLEGYLVDLRKAGAERITLFVSVYYDGQCNLGFSAEELGRIAHLGVDLAISCYGLEAE